MRRTQIYLEDEQTARLADRAQAARTTRSELIRRAIDDYLDRPDEDDERARLARFKEAVREVAGIAPYLSQEQLREMRAAGARNLDELERRGRD